MRKLLSLIGACILFAGCAQTNQPASSNQGVLIMAHGGSEEWNEGVRQVVEPLLSQHNVEVAFGMADAYSMQEAVTKLEKKGAEEIAVVRLFISGESFYERTEQILGLTEGAPVRPEQAGMAMGEDAMEMPGGMRMEFWQVDSRASFELSQEGMADAVEMNQVLLERALALSSDPANEDVLILAHGPGDDEENQRWLDNINARASLIRSTAPFRQVHVATLREDWEEKRVIAEKEIREFVSDSSRNGRTAIVIPYRINGFGPYAEVLEGLEYKSDGRGLVPNLAVTQWIERQVRELKRD